MFQVAVESNKLGGQNCWWKELDEGADEVTADSQHVQKILFTAEDWYTEDGGVGENKRSTKIRISRRRRTTDDHATDIDEEDVGNFTS